MSAPEQAYRVVRGPIQARFANPVGGIGGYRIGGQHYYDGQVLPPIEPEQRDHLLSLGMIEPVPELADQEPA